MPNAVIIHTVRGGRDPDEHWIAVTEELAQALTPHDPWRELGGLLDSNDPGILTGISNYRSRVMREMVILNYNVVRTMEAVGY